MKRVYTLFFFFRNGTEFFSLFKANRSFLLFLFVEWPSILFGKHWVIWSCRCGWLRLRKNRGTARFTIWVGEISEQVLQVKECAHGEVVLSHILLDWAGIEDVTFSRFHCPLVNQSVCVSLQHLLF